MSPYRDSPSDGVGLLARRLSARAPIHYDEGFGAGTSADQLVRAIQRISRDDTLASALVDETGLSAPMVRWALESTAAGITLDALDRLRDHAGLHAFGRINRARLSVCVLAGNVFTACLRPMVLSLLFEVPTLVRTSSRESLLPRAFAAALPSPFAEACGVVSFPKDDDSAWASLLAHADSVHVYGADETVRAIRARAPAHTRFIPHGHGLGVAVARSPEPGTPPPFEGDAARALALDVAAYDQRGCLSPQELLIVGGREDAERAALLVHDALADLARELPRGPLPPDVAAASARWCDTALAVGAVHEGEEHAIAVDPTGMLPFGPGHRHLVVRALRDDDALRAHLASYGPHLKSLGHHLGSDDANALAVPFSFAFLPSGTAPRITPFGQMQTPPIDAPLDGYPPSEGFLTYLATH